MRPTRLVLCDDVDDIRMLMRVAFENDGDFEIVGEASNGEEGIAAVRELKPDALLLDVNMPVKGGLEALPTIREVAPDTAIVIFSGFEEWSLGGEAREQGADAYIEKGTDVGEIVELVRGVVQERLRGRDGADGSSS
jgi:DNA-binding NarL/FixJ family response regulator